jgi:hypothetical protein
MELEELKTVWTKQKSVGYSQAELNSIFHIKQKHRFASLKSGLSRDLQVSILIAVVFIVVLQIFNLKTSNFWSVCMAIFALQHTLFYRFQTYLLRKYSVFNNDISQSLTTAIGKINGLLWFYRLWPAVLSIILSIIYAVVFKPEQPVWLMSLIGTSLAASIAGLSNVISAVLVRKHLLKLTGLKNDLIKLSG